MRLWTAQITLIQQPNWSRSQVAPKGSRRLGTRRAHDLRRLMMCRLIWTSGHRVCSLLDDWSALRHVRSYSHLAFQTMESPTGSLAKVSSHVRCHQSRNLRIHAAGIHYRLGSQLGCWVTVVVTEAQILLQNGISKPISAQIDPFAEFFPLDGLNMWPKNEGAVMSCRHLHIQNSEDIFRHRLQFFGPHAFFVAKKFLGFHSHFSEKAVFFRAFSLIDTVFPQGIYTMRKWKSCAPPSPDQKSGFWLFHPKWSSGAKSFFFLLHDGANQFFSPIWETV